MYVCICRRVTDKQVKDAVCQGARCLRDINTHVGTPIQCGKCCQFMKQVLQDTLSTLNNCPGSLA